ncbi:hypothetical protein B0A49_02507, partial [Cryomyces minteri]
MQDEGAGLERKRSYGRGGAGNLCTSPIDHPPAIRTLINHLQAVRLRSERRKNKLRTRRKRQPKLLKT